MSVFLASDSLRFLSEVGVPPLSSVQCASKHGLNSPPAISLDEFDDTPFSESFTGWIEAENCDAACADTSYDVEQITDIRQFAPEWLDDEVDEIIIMSPKTPQGVNLATIYEVAEEVVSKRDVNINDFEIINNSPSHTLCRRRSNGKVYAMKRVKSFVGPSISQHLTIVSAINQLYAPFLARMNCHFVHDNLLHIIMDNGHHGDLLSLVSRSKVLHPSHALVYASELIEALDTLHLAGIVHRSLCPENIQIDIHGHILLTGFDDASFLDERTGEITARSYHGIVRSHHKQHCEYRPPEVLLGWETHDSSADCWGFGLVLYFMLSGQHAFGLEDNVNLHNVLYGGISLDFTIPLSPKARDLILRCVVKNSNLRLAVKQIKMHEYFDLIDWRQVQDKRLRVPQFSEPTGTLPKKASLLSSSSVTSGHPIDSPSHDTLVPPTFTTTSAPIPKRPALEGCSSSDSAISKLSLDAQPFYNSLLPSIFCPSASSQRSPSDLYATGVTSQLESLSSEKKMAQFWKSLDEEFPEPSISLSSSTLRKQKSFPILGSPRLSLLLPNKLRRKKLTRSTSHAALKSPEPLLDLPIGIEQKGHGIGFTYSSPTAAISKASICTTPKSCHGLLGTKKTRGKLHALPNIGKSSMETIYGCSESTRRMSSMEDRSPFLDEVFESPTALRSPLSDAGPLTPPQAPFQLFFDPDMTKMLPSSTLRLVSPSDSMLSLGSHPFYDLL